MVTMRAQCCICFNSLESSQITACPCGHTFHEKCLTSWLDTSFTCPTCRESTFKFQIIKLFFDNDGNEEDDVENLLKQISDLKGQLNLKDKEWQELVESKCRLSTQFTDSEATRELLLTKFNDEKNIKDGMQRDLTEMLAKYAPIIETMKELRTTSNMNRQKLEKSEEAVLQGIYTFHHYMAVEDNESSLKKRLSSLLSLLKWEYDQVQSEKTTLQEQVSELKCSAENYDTEAQKYKQEADELRISLEITRTNLTQVQSEKTTLQEQVSELKCSAENYDTEAQKYKQEADELRISLEITRTNLTQVQSEQTTMKEQVTELKCSAENYDTEAREYKLEVEELRYLLEITRTNLTQVQSEESFLQQQVTELKLYAEHYDNEAQKYKQQAMDLEKRLENTNTSLSQVQSEKTSLQQQVSELVFSPEVDDTEAKKYKQQEMELRMMLENTNTSQVKSEKTVLEQVSELQCSAEHYKIEAQKYKQEAMELEMSLEEKNTILSLVEKSISDNCHAIMIGHRKTAAVCMDIDAGMKRTIDLMGDKENTNTCMSPDFSFVARQNLKRKCLSELNGPANIPTSSGNFKASKLTKSEAIVNDIPKVSQEVLPMMQKKHTISKHQLSSETLTGLETRQRPYALRSSKNRIEHVPQISPKEKCQQKGQTNETLNACNKPDRSSMMSSNIVKLSDDCELIDLT